MNDFFENIISFPIVLLEKLLKFLLPVLLILIVVVSVFKSPHIAASFCAGFLLAPPILRRLEVYHLDVTNSLSALLQKNQEIRVLEVTYKAEIDRITKQHQKKEQRLQNKILTLNKQTTDFDKKYREVIKRKPDRILYDQPRTFLEWIKGRILWLGEK